MALMNISDFVASWRGKGDEKQDVVDQCKERLQHFKRPPVCHEPSAGHQVSYQRF